MKPLVSVIVPTLNRREILARVMDSLLKQMLGQDIYEVIIVDNNPLDCNYEFFRSLNLPDNFCYFRQTKPGAAAARNLGILKSNGLYILFIDDDVVADKNLILEHLNYCKDNLYDVSVGRLVISPDIKKIPFVSFIEEWELHPSYHGLENGAILAYPYFNTANLMIKKQLLQRLKGFDEEFNYYGWEDVELGYRLSLEGVNLVFNSNAIGIHFVTEDLKSYSLKMELIGRTAIKLLGKHPVLVDLINLLNFDELRGIYRYNLKEIDKLNLDNQGILRLCRKIISEIEKLKFPFKDDVINSEIIKEILYECYGIILRQHYLLGLQAGLREIDQSEREKLLSKIKSFEIVTRRRHIDNLEKSIKYIYDHPLIYLKNLLKRKINRGTR